MKNLHAGEVSEIQRASDILKFAVLNVQRLALCWEAQLIDTFDGNVDHWKIGDRYVGESFREMIDSRVFDSNRFDAVQSDERVAGN